MEEEDKRATSPSGGDASRPSSSSKHEHEPDEPTSAVDGPDNHENYSGAGTGSGRAPGDSVASNPKRRRGLGIVTPNACTECRKKRAKCDGGTPCSRCRSQRDVECVYEVPVRQSKENLRQEIETLRQQKQHSDYVFSALNRGELHEEVLEKIRKGDSLAIISDWLASPAAQQTRHQVRNNVPTFARPTEPQSGVSLPALSNYGGVVASNSSFAPMSLSPVTAHQQHSLRPHQDLDPNSPWNASSQSHTVSNRSDSHPDVMQWAAEPHSRVGTWISDQSHTASDGSRPRSGGYRGVDQVLAPLDESPDLGVSPQTWTGVTRDPILVQHLLALYFCWEYPTFASLSKEHFLRDFIDGRNRYCSPILVNALMALGCRFSSQPNTRANPNDPYTSGDHFFKESLSLFHKEHDHHNLTTIQALGIMSIREASCGRDSESWYYAGQSIRLAIEMGLHRLQDDGDEDEYAVQAATFWGAFALDHAWSLATGSLPQCSCFPQLPPKPAIIDDIEASLWIPYTDDGAPLQRSCEQPSNVRSVYKCFCELSELVHQSAYVLHTPSKPVTSRDLLSIYTQYLNWYDRIPEVLRLGHNFTPAVLFAHMYYHFAILLLFRPLIKLRIIGSSILPRDVCTQAADAIQGLLRSYSQLYTLRRTPSFVPYFVLTSTIMHLAVGATEANEGQATSPAAMSNSSTVKADEAVASNGDKSQPSGHERSSPEPKSNTSPKGNARVRDALSQGISDLHEMAPCHHFAEQALNILQFLAKKWGIHVDIPAEKKMDVEEAHKLGRPVTSSLNFFAPNFQQEDLICSWGTDHPKEHYNAPQKMRPENRRVDSDVDEADMMQGVEEAMQNNDQPGKGFPPGQSVRGPGDQGPVAHTSKSMENPLFWPFPMQGRPMLPEGPELREAGFERL